MKRKLILTVDVDRDANFEAEGRAEARSMDRGCGDNPRFSSSEEGLGIITDVLDEIGMKATFFVEGRAAEIIDCSSLSGHCIGFHGYDHENLTKCGDPSIVMERGFSAVKDRISSPKCFRAPYMKADDRTLEALRMIGIGHDSSFYADSGVPYDIRGITEHPVSRSRDSEGKTIVAYLWPMHEGRRTPDDYVRMASAFEGDFVLATHSWHMVERYEDGKMDDAYVGKNKDSLRFILEALIDSGFTPEKMV